MGFGGFPTPRQNDQEKADYIRQADDRYETDNRRRAQRPSFGKDTIVGPAFIMSRRRVFLVQAVAVE